MPLGSLLTSKARELASCVPNMCIMCSKGSYTAAAVPQPAARKDHADEGRVWALTLEGTYLLAKELLPLILVCYTLT